MLQTLQTKGYLYTFSKDSFGRDEAKSTSHKRKIKDEIIRTLIADDHPYLIQGVEVDLNKDPKIKIVGTCNSYDDVLSTVNSSRPDVVLLDLKMPGYDKHDLQHLISKIKKDGHSKVAIFSNETGWARVHRCLEIGADAYIEKAIAIGKLPDLIHTMHEENELLIYTAERLPELNFSPRQSEILHLIADGKENDEISAHLNIEVKTIQSYVNEIKSKFAKAFDIYPIRPRTLLLIASKLGFGSNQNL